MADKKLYLEAFHDKGRLKIGVYSSGDVVSSYEDITSLPMARLDEHCRETVATLNRAARTGGGAAGVLESLKVMGRILGDELLSPNIKVHIRQAEASHLIVRADDQLIHIPWELVCLDDEFLCQRFSMGRLVKTREQIAHTPPRAMGKPCSAWILTHAGTDLVNADSEGLGICKEMDKLNQETDCIEASLDTDVIAREVQEKIRDYDLVHFAGHAEHHTGSPGESGWKLVDGLFTAQDTYKMAGGPPMPALVFSNACQSARSVEGEWGGESNGDSFGMAKAFMLAGVRHYIGTFWEMPDEPSSKFAIQFYKHFLNGATIGESVKLARLKLMDEYGPDIVCWASYLLYGDPSISYFEPADLRLIHETKNGERVYPVPLSGELLAGRRKTNDVVVDKPMVSRLHFTVNRDGGNTVLNVLSRNGIKIAGEFFRGELQLDAPLRFELWGEWFRLEGISLHEEEKPTVYLR